MIVFCWAEFPQYAARCVGALVRATDVPVVVVATRPKVPIAGMEERAGCPVIWIAEDETRSLAELLSTVSRPDAARAGTLLFTSGWSVAVFNRFRDEVRAEGGRVVAMVDNPRVRSGVCAFMRETLKALRFRLTFRSRYDGYFVPGAAGRRLLRFYGVPEKKVRTGVYAADDGLFRPGAALSVRPKRILYVGQFIARKNVLAMCRAFIAADGSAKGWTLELCGAGTLEGELKSVAGTASIRVRPFLQPEALAEEYRSVRALCLPSVEENWGLVVHEAALSGCLLMLSDRVGARADFEGAGNVVAFDPSDERAMAAAFARVFALTDAALDAAGAESARCGRAGASLAKFVEGALGVGG